MVRGRVAGDSVTDVGPASVMVGNIVQGNRLASAQGRDMGVLDEDSDNAKKVCIFEKILRLTGEIFLYMLLMYCLVFFFLPFSINLSLKFYGGVLSALRIM